MSDCTEEPLVAARFTVTADASPGLLSRVLEPFAKRDLVPDLVRATRDGEVIRAATSGSSVQSDIWGNSGSGLGDRQPGRAQPHPDRGAGQAAGRVIRPVRIRRVFTGQP